MNVSTYLTLATNAKVSNDKHQQAAKEDPWMIDFFFILELRNTEAYSCSAFSR